MMSLVDYGGSSSESEGEDNNEQVPQESLPKPPTAPRPTSSNYVGSSHPSAYQCDNDEVEESLKMRVPGNLTLEDILKLKPKKKKKEKIRIAALTVSDDSDSDSEAKKAPKRPVVGTGPRKTLSSLLPAPQALIVREGNRPLIPHVVSRKAAAPKPTTATAAKKNVAGGTETSPPAAEEPKLSSFFTLDDDDDLPPPVLDTTAVPGPTVQPPNSSAPKVEEQMPDLEMSQPMRPIGTDFSDAPSEFIPECERRYQRKRKRGDIPDDIIDIRQDQLTAGVEIELTKTISQEEDEFKKRPADRLPSRLAASKHQITWLAHKAKEMEFELKNSWATAKHNKMQTRNKYGF